MLPRRRPGARRRRLKIRAVLALAGLILTVGLWKLAAPLATIHDQSGRLAQLETQKANLLAQRGALEADRAELATQSGQEAAARRQGYVRPGERRLVFVRDERAQTEPAVSRADPAPDS
jgi:cell division protein FtsB